MKNFKNYFRALAIIAALILAFTADTQITASMVVCVLIIFAFIAYDIKTQGL